MIRSFACLLAICSVAPVTISAHATPLKMDLVFVFDVSESNYGFGLKERFAPRIERIIDRFDGYGVDARYGVVLFGRDNQPGIPHVMENLIDGQFLVDNTVPQLLAHDFELAEWVNPPSGITSGSEDSYGALAVALNGMLNYKTSATESLGPQPIQVQYRQDATKLIILMADEAPQHSGYSQIEGGTLLWPQDMFPLINDRDAIVNVLTRDDPNLTTDADFFLSYGKFATESGGQVFGNDLLWGPNIPDIESLLDQFVDDLVDVKYQELLTAQIPEPSSLGLLWIGMATIATFCRVVERP